MASGDPESVGSRAAFELSGGNGPGWYCYSERFGGSELLLRSLGLIPGLQHQERGAVPA